MEFDATGDRIAIPDDTAFQLTQSVTLEAYIRIDAYPINPAGLAQIIFRGDSRLGLDPYFLSLQNSGQLRFLITDAANSDSIVVSPSPQLPLNELLHVAGTIDDSTGSQSLYINGSLVASSTTTIRPFGILTGPNPGLGISGLQVDGDQYFDGLIDEVRISDAALNPAEMLPPVPEPSTLLLFVLATMTLRVRGHVCRGANISRTVT
jgi:hypothetical protein